MEGKQASSANCISPRDSCGELLTHAEGSDFSWRRVFPRASSERTACAVRVSAVIAGLRRVTNGRCERSVMMQ